MPHSGEPRTNDRHPIEELFQNLRKCIEKRRKMKTLEYILTENPNGDLQQTELVATDEYRLNSKINLIPYNQVDGLEWRRPTLSQIRAF